MWYIMVGLVEWGARGTISQASNVGILAGPVGCFWVRMGKGSRGAV